MTTRKYYTVCTLEDTEDALGNNPRKRWCPQFGDYDKSVVVQEAIDTYHEYTVTIITTGDNQAVIDGYVHQMNTHQVPIKKYKVSKYEDKLTLIRS